MVPQRLSGVEALLLPRAMSPNHLPFYRNRIVTMEEEADDPSKKEAISEWVHTYGDYLYSWAYHKTSCNETAEDLVQEVYFAAFKNYDKFEGRSSPKTWLLKILNNKIIDHYRKLSNNEGKQEDATSQFTDSFFNPIGNWKANGLEEAWTDEEHLLDNAAFNEVMEICMNDLPAKWRLAILSKFLLEKEAVAIFQDLDITASNYWQVIHRAKLLLKKCLEVNWFAKN